MMLGYAKDHGKGTYRVYKASTKRVVLSRDVIWQPFQSKNLGEELEIFEAGVTETTEDSNIDSIDKENKTLKHLKTDKWVYNESDSESDSDSDSDSESDSDDDSMPELTQRGYDSSDDESDSDSEDDISETDTEENDKDISYNEEKDSDEEKPQKTKSPTKKRKSTSMSTHKYPTRSKITPGITLRNKKELHVKGHVTGDTTVTKIDFGDKDEGEDGTAVHLIHQTQDNTLENGIITKKTIAHMQLVQQQEIYNINTMELSNDYGTPNTIRQALNGPEKELWRQSAIAEINNFLKRGSWKFIQKDKVLKQGRKPIATKWVFKIKNESNHTKRYKSRVVTKGYMQIPGVDYTEKFSPVATASSLRIGLALTLHNDNEEEPWVCELVDVEAAFLEGKLKKSTYINIPQGMVELGFMTQTEFEDNCIELLGGMYGNVDAALLYFMRFTTFATSQDGLKMTQSESDPCVFFRRNKQGEIDIMIIIYVDDCMLIGTQESVNETKAKLRTEFGTTEDGQLKKLLGVRYDWEKTTDGEPYIKMSMNDKADEIIDSYQKITGRTPKIYSTPGAPGTVLTKNEGTMVMLDEYRSMIGKLLFYGTKIAPECAFANGQLARHMQNPGEEHWKALERMVGYLKGKEKHELIMRRPLNLRIISYGDSSYGDCKDTRRSSSGDFHTLGGALVSWRSQRLKMVCLSSTEAEYVTMTEMAKEQRFLQMLMEELTGKLETGVIYGDNEAAMYLSKNKHVSARTKHIDIRSHYVRDHIEESRAILKAEKSEMNFSDILTKNTSVNIFKRLSTAILKGFQGEEDKFTWKESINMITTNTTRFKKHNQQKRSENIFDKTDLEEMESYYKKYKKRIGENTCEEGTNVMKNSKARSTLYENETNNHARARRKLAYDQKQRENVENYLSTKYQCQKRAAYTGRNIQNTHLWKTPKNNKGAYRAENGKNVSEKQRTNTTAKSANRQYSEQRTNATAKSAN